MKKSLLLRLLLLSFFISVLLFGFFLIGIFSGVEMQLLDNYYGGYEPLDDIVIVAIDDQSIQEIGQWPWKRNVYVDLLEQIEDAKVVAFDIGFYETSDDDAEFAEAISDSANVILSLEHGNFYIEDGDLYGTETLTPVPVLYKEAIDVGYVNLVTDNDGVTRAVNLNIKGDHESFSEVVYESFLGTSSLHTENRFLINYVDRPGTFTTYSFNEVIQDDFDSSIFDGKIVLVGATAQSLRDVFFVPTSKGEAMAGVEIHANGIQTLITQRTLQVQSPWLIFLLFLCFSLATSVLISAYKFIKSGIILFVAIILYIFVTIMLFNKGMIFSILYIPLVSIAAYSANAAYLAHFLNKEKKKVLGAFEKYVSPVIIKQLLDHPEYMKLGGTRKEITLFFSDIRGFTSVSEKLSPEDLVSLLNEYLSEMTKIIIDKGGVVDKFMGDAIMAFWGAPIKQPNQATLACETSLEMLDKLDKLRKDWKKRGVPSFDIGIGLNTGDAVTGNMGSYQRFDYTAMGDSVNLASRLEGINKIYGTRIIVSIYTKRKTHNFVFRELDKVKVKGKQKPEIIYELICRKGDSYDKEKIETFEKALLLYYHGKFKEALEILSNVDGPSKNLIKRCKFLIKNPPKDWDGVWTMTTK